MSEELMLDVGQANEIKLAARRAGATSADLKRLCEGDMFAQILPVLRGQAKITSAFPTLMTVKLGSGLKTATGFRRAIKKAGQNLGNSASDSLNHSASKVAYQPTNVSIIAPTVAELGFLTGGRYADICQRGLKLGYGYCPFELGPQLRLQYKNQPKGEKLYLAMKVICDSDGDLSTFVVEHNDSGLWLNVQYVIAKGFYHVCPADTRIVFVCRK